MAVDSKGNQVVDFVYGNMPMQPDTGRGTALDKTLDNHVMVSAAYNGFPSHVANQGVTVPNFVGVTAALIKAAVAAAGLTVGTVTGSTGAVTVQSRTAGSHCVQGSSINYTLV